jgi:hypothetical protein
MRIRIITSAIRTSSSVATAAAIWPWSVARWIWSMMMMVWRMVRILIRRSSTFVFIVLAIFRAVFFRFERCLTTGGCSCSSSSCGLTRISKINSQTLFGPSEWETTHLFYSRLCSVDCLVSNVSIAIAFRVFNLLNRTEAVKFALQLNGRSPSAETTDPYFRCGRSFTIPDFALKLSNILTR